MASNILIRQRKPRRITPARAANVSPSGVYLRKHGKRKYDAIMRSAARLFFRHGYTRTSMDAIALDAGVSKQTVYSYFTNKDMLFCHMIEEECLRHSPAESLLVDPSLKPDDALFSIAHGYIDMIGSPRGASIYRLVMAEAARHPRIARLFYECGPQKMQALLTHYLERQKKLGVFAIDDVAGAAIHFAALVKGRYYLRLALRLKPAPTRKEIDTHIRDAIRVFNKVYGC